MRFFLWVSISLLAACGGGSSGSSGKSVLLGDDLYAVESVFALPELQQLYWPVWMAKIASFAPDSHMAGSRDRCQSGSAAYKAIYAGQELRLYNCLYQGVSYSGAVKLTVGAFDAGVAIKTDDLLMSTLNGQVKVMGQIVVTAYEGARYSVNSSSAIVDVEGTVFRHSDFKVHWVDTELMQFAYDGRLQASDGRYRQYLTNRWMRFDGSTLLSGDIRWVDHVGDDGALRVDEGTLIKSTSGIESPTRQYFSAAELGVPFWEVNF
ncbi:MAG: hypothetical protein HWE20_06510 [Gammaproteobacteria bacterium]|nr:hypothetical protein [Gammaproteobacteria bacterium]